LTDRIHHFVEHADDRKHGFLIVQVCIGQFADVHDYHSVEDFVYCLQAPLAFLQLFYEISSKELLELNAE
jgi:hypothetical protein